MIYIQHRVNLPGDLERLDPSLGVEIDLRSQVDEPGKLHLSHDPWSRGADFEEWLLQFRNSGLKGPIILNTKEDGLEQVIMDRLQAAGLTNWFFLDTALPTLRRQALVLGRNCFAVRLSSVEPWESVAAFAGKVDWVWVDCFDGVPMPVEQVRQAASAFRVCLVSPELQGCPLDKLPEFQSLLPCASAICTKNPAAWRQLAEG